MKTMLRSSITLVPALGLTVFMIHAAISAGLNADSTVTAFCFLAIVGMVEAALQTVRFDAATAEANAGPSNATSAFMAHARDDRIAPQVRLGVCCRPNSRQRAVAA